VQFLARFRGPIANLYLGGLDRARREGFRLGFGVYAKFSRRIFVGSHSPLSDRLLGPSSLFKGGTSQRSFTRLISIAWMCLLKFALRGLYVLSFTGTAQAGQQRVATGGQMSASGYDQVTESHGAAAT
jgi:hypothetical protein